MYTAEMQWNRINEEIGTIIALKNGLKCVGMTLDRPNINRRIARLFKEEYEWDATFCLLHILNQIASRARNPFVGILEELELLMTALNSTKLGDVLKTLLDEDWYRRARQRLNNNNNNINNNDIDIEMNEVKEEKEEKEDRKYKSGIPSRAVTRTWLSEGIICQWVLKKRHIVQQLVRNEAAAPYLTPVLIRLLSNDDFFQELHRYAWGLREILVLMKKWQGSVCCNCLCLCCLFVLFVCVVCLGCLFVCLQLCVCVIIILLFVWVVCNLASVIRCLSTCLQITCFLD